MCFVGVDLSSWYNTKTKIAVIEKEGELVYFSEIISEDSLHKGIKKGDFANESIISYDEKNQKLIEQILSYNPNIVAIDAPFAIPAPLVGSSEEYWEDSDAITSELKNPYIYDNSARFIYSMTKKKPLAPASDLIGKLTARMVQIQNNNPHLEFVKNTNLNRDKLQFIEVYPQAVLNKIKSYIPPYKKSTKFKDEIFKVYNKELMDILAELISEEFVQTIPEINNDDEFDALICAVSAYLIYHNGYMTPSESQKFTNSFIFVPKV
jgi:predicted nuclease with RNAse H fold